MKKMVEKIFNKDPQIIILPKNKGIKEIKDINIETKYSSTFF